MNPERAKKAVSVARRGLADPVGRRLTHQGTKLAKGAQYSTAQHRPSAQLDYFALSFVCHLLLGTILASTPGADGLFQLVSGEEMRERRGSDTAASAGQTQFCVGAHCTPAILHE